jgi:hypothetical protein
MTCSFKYLFTIAICITVFVGILQGSALGIQMRIEGIDDAGQEAGQPAYLKFVVDPSGVTLTTITTAEVSNQWASSSDVYSYATLNNIPSPWLLQSAGNIWSSDTIVGDPFTAPHAGVYRISPADGAFQYDSFLWSPDVAGKWLWQLQIYAVGGANYTLGSDDLYDSADVALGANLGNYMDIALAEGGKLIFWIADGRLDGDPSKRNTIDNSGGLTFNVVLIPEPSTIILSVTGLFFLARRFRKHLCLH